MNNLSLNGFQEGDNNNYGFFKNSKLDKINGPAYIHNDGSVAFFRNHVIHRDNLDGPAVILPNGDMIWYENGLIHNSYGPSVKLITGRQYFSLFGVEYPEYIVHKYNKFHSKRISNIQKKCIEKWKKYILEKREYQNYLANCSIDEFINSLFQ